MLKIFLMPAIRNGDNLKKHTACAGPEERDKQGMSSTKFIKNVFFELVELCPHAMLALSQERLSYLSPDAGQLLAIDMSAFESDGSFVNNEDYPILSVTGKPFSVFFENAHSYDYFRSTFLARINTEKSIKTIHPLKRMDGEFFLARFTGRATKYYDAEIVLTIEDITESEEEYAEIYYRFYQLNHDLRFFRNSYRQMLEAVNMGIVILKPDGTVIETNPYIRKMLGNGWTGKKCFEMCGKMWSSGESGVCAFCRMPDVVKSGQPIREFITDRHGNHWLFTWTPVIDDRGKIARIIKTVADITPEVKLKERIALQEELLATIVEIIPAGILIIDASGEVEYTNRTFAKRWGFDKSAMIGIEFGELDIYDNHGFVNRIRSAMMGGKALEGVECQCEDDDGSLHVFTCNFYPLNLSDGRPRGLLVEIDRTADVMHRREAEALAHSLDREIREKNRAIIEQEKLVAVGRLAAGITHELNTPTTYVRGNLQVFDKYVAELQEEIKKFTDISASQKSIEIVRRIKDLLNTMHNSSRAAFLGTERIMNIISSMRGFVRQEAEGDEKINLYEALRDALVLIFNRVKQHGSITINNWKFRPEDTGRFIATHYLPVAGSSQRLCQLFVNLVNNSIDAWNDIMAKRVGRERLELNITVTTRGGSAHMIICDNAGGMPKDVEQKVFEPFFTTRSGRKGTGLGLNIAAQIVREHSGEITLENQYDRGVCWYISLPWLNEDI